MEVDFAALAEENEAAKNVGVEEEPAYEKVGGEDELTRFDSKSRSGGRNKRGGKGRDRDRRSGGGERPKGQAAGAGGQGQPQGPHPPRQDRQQGPRPPRQEQGSRPPQPSKALVRQGRSTPAQRPGIRAVIAHPTPVRGPGVDVIAIVGVVIVADHGLKAPAQRPGPRKAEAMEAALLPRLRREAFFWGDHGPGWGLAVRGIEGGGHLCCSFPCRLHGECGVPRRCTDTERGLGAQLEPDLLFEVSDTVSTHDVYLDLRHTGDYPFSNLYAFVTLTSPDSTRLVDTVECTLADPSGRWYGKGQGFISSDRFQAHVLYKLRNKFPRRGRYSLMLEQAMRVEKLEGIIDVGVSVERSKGG